MGVQTLAELALQGAEQVDYADRFRIRTTRPEDPRAWAQAMFGDAADPGQTVIFRGVLGMPVGTVLGGERVAVARIERAEGARRIWLADASDLVSCRLLVEVAPDRQGAPGPTDGCRGSVSLTTLISYRDRRGRSRWSCLAPVHRRLAPGLLRDAAATMEGLALSAERVAPTAQAEN